MEYKEDNMILKGFSQVELDELNKKLEINNKLLRQQTIIYGVMGFVLILIMLWGLWQIKHYRIITQLIMALGG